MIYILDNESKCPKCNTDVSDKWHICHVQLSCTAPQYIYVSPVVNCKNISKWEKLILPIRKVLGTLLDTPPIIAVVHSKRETSGDIVLVAVNLCNLFLWACLILEKYWQKRKECEHTTFGIVHRPASPITGAAVGPLLDTCVTPHLCLGAGELHAEGITIQATGEVTRVTGWAYLRGIALQLCAI